MLKNNRVSLLKLIMLLSLFIPFSVWSEEDLFPEYWPTLPEYQSSNKSLPKKLDDDIHPNQTIDNIFDSQNELFSEIKDRSPKEKWFLEAYRMSLGVSNRGLIGPVTMTGRSSVIFTWKRRPKENKSEDKSLSEESSAPEETVLLNAFSTDDELEHQLGESIDFTFSTLPVAARKKAKKALLVRALEMQELFTALSSSKYSGDWFVGTLRFDVGFSASGDILPVLSMRGEFRLRLEFYAIEAKSPSSSGGEKNFVSSPKFLNIQKFATNLLEDADFALRSTEAKKIVDNGFDLSIIRLGIGMSTEGNIGAAAVGGRAMAQIYLHRALKKSTSGNKQNDDLSDSDTMDYIANSDPQRERYALDNGISFLPDGDNKSVSEEKIFKVSRKKFRKGLVRSLKMGTFFSGKANKGNFKTWKLNLIENEYDLSIGGNLVLARVDGTVLVRFVFEARD